MGAKKPVFAFHPAIAAINAFKAVKGLDCAPLKEARRVHNTVSSGSLSIDLILGGGFPSGKFVTIFGPEGCGKSTLLQELIVSCQMNFITVVHYDFESGSDPVYMSNQGIDLDHSIVLPKINKNGTPAKTGNKIEYPNYFYCQPDFGEQMYRHILVTLKALPEVENKPPQIVFLVDSFAAMSSEEVDDETGEGRIAPQARMHSNFLQMIRPRLKRKGALLLGSNQMRTAIGQWGNPQKEYGGAALMYYPDQKIMLTRRKLVKDKTKVDVLPITARTTKNKVFMPHRILEGLGIILARGLDRSLDAEVFLKKTGHLKVTGNGLRQIVFPKKETKKLSWMKFRQHVENPKFRAFLFRRLKKDRVFEEYMQHDGPQNYFYDQDFEEYEEEEIDQEEVQRRVEEEGSEYRDLRRRRRKQGKKGKKRSKKQTRNDEELEEEMAS